MFADINDLFQSSFFQELRFMTSRLKTMDKENEIESDWKFAAMVIDRSLSKLNSTSIET